MGFYGQNHGDVMRFEWEFQGSSPPEPKVIGDDMAGIGLKIAV